MTLKWLFFQEIEKIAQQLGAQPPDPAHNTFELHQFAQHAAQLQHVLDRIISTFRSSPLAKPWLELLGFSFIQWIMNTSLASPLKKFLRLPVAPGVTILSDATVRKKILGSDCSSFFFFL